jgi:hypothetical protein
LNFPRAPEGRDPDSAAPGANSLGGDDSYSRWMRTTMKAVAGAPDAAVLFDSTIREPTDLLAGVVRRAFDGEVTDRYESVFAEGNRFAVAAVAARYGVPATQVIGTTGATSAMNLILRALVVPGDDVLIEHPCFDLLPALARDAGATVTALPRRAPDFAVDPDEIARLIKPNTRLIVLTQLHNPSGAVLEPQTLKAIGAVARKAGVPVLIDEAYGDFAGENVSAVQYGPEFISAGSLTKVQGLFALKCGWAAASPEIIARIHAANPQGDLGVSKLAHAIAALVLEDRAPFDAHWRGVLAQARPVVEAQVSAMTAAGLIEGALPAKGCIYFPRLVGIDDTRALARWLWSEHGVAVAAGEFFGLAGHIRIGFGGGQPAALERGLTRLADALKLYPGRS